MHGRYFFNSDTIMCIKYGLLFYVLFLNCNGVQTNSLWPPKLLGKLNPEDKAKPLPPPTKNVGASDVNPCIRNGCKIFGPLCEHGKCTESVSLNSCQWMCRCEPGWRGYLCEEMDIVQIPILKPIASTTTTTSTTTVAPTTVTVTDNVTPTSTSTVQSITSTPTSTTNEASEAVTSSSTTTTAATTTINTDARETTTGVPTTVLSTTTQTDTSATTGKATKGPTTDTTTVTSSSTESDKTTTEHSTTSTTGASIDPTTSTMPAGVVPVTSTTSESQFKGSSTLQSTESVTSAALVSSTMSAIPVRDNFPRAAAQTQRKETPEKIYRTTAVPQQLDDTTSATVATDSPVITTTSKPLTETTTISRSTTEVQDTTRHVSYSGQSTRQVPVVTAGKIVQPAQISSSLKPTTDAPTTNVPSTTASDTTTSTTSEITIKTTKAYTSKAASHISSEPPSTTLEPTSTRVVHSTTSVLSTRRPLVKNVKLEQPKAAKTPSLEEVVLFPPKLSARKRKPFISEMLHSKPKQTSQEEDVLLSETVTNPSPKQKTTTTAKTVVGTKNMIHQSLLKDIKKMHTFFTNLGGTARNILPDNKKV